MCYLLLRIPKLLKYQIYSNTKFSFFEYQNQPSFTYPTVISKNIQKYPSVCAKTIYPSFTYFAKQTQCVMDSCNISSTRHFITCRKINMYKYLFRFSISAFLFFTHRRTLVRNRYIDVSALNGKRLTRERKKYDKITNI